VRRGGVLDRLGVRRGRRPRRAANGPPADHGSGEALKPTRRDGWAWWSRLVRPALRLRARVLALELRPQPRQPVEVVAQPVLGVVARVPDDPHRAGVPAVADYLQHLR